MIDYQRYRRSMEENIFLLNFDEQKMEFLICGKTKKTYTINFNEEKQSTCTCMDFKLRKTVCKHQIFIISRCGKVSYEDLNEMFETKVFPFSKIWKRLKNEMQTKLKGNGDDCCICLSEMKTSGISEDSFVVQCKSCNNFYHLFCINNWLSASKKCPLCRVKMKNVY
jgi:hypothetical protein